ncbi:dihydroxyacetone kinase subunit L [Flavimobilis marinus]|uniref:Dihydroxyacetone kinase DhaL subunit n=1 Tax=Flavimobilis marinus TaxID=285351 RepID=A0A1I2E292_9MICO|nr:dihydroxyacetone kinase subunit DhaL [Flavimobilis marinus]GHG43799.1 dihydroxyacetone kinase subunit L [Flavimobilis marinus]SFE86743.1 dihydroxyacetone kinase DhaL subunit [Flavimobilis marinus]
MTLDVEWARRWVALAAQAITEAKDELVELDREIGDGDHGVNLDRGFAAVAAKIEGMDRPATVGEILTTVATTLMSSVGGASGPLYGTAFLRAGKVSGLAELGPDAVVALLEGALEGITSRGRAGVGEKTMVDAWAPAVEAAVRSAGAGDEPAAVLRAAADAAADGARSTIPLVASKGRASYLGERSAGHMDPGARSSAILLDAAARAAA